MKTRSNVELFHLIAIRVHPGSQCELTVTLISHFKS